MMKWIRMAAGLVGVVFAVANTLSVQGGNPDPSAVKQEKAEKSSKFEGRWIVVSSTVDGDAQDMQGDRVHLAKGKITVEEHGGDVQECTYEADTTKKPHHIDVTPKQGKDKGKVFKGILILEENLLKLCLARPGDDRPTEASSQEGSGHILLVLEPAKSER
jgi:uncharacterized protein (TIGR03067 family)